MDLRTTYGKKLDWVCHLLLYVNADFKDTASDAVVMYICSVWFYSHNPQFTQCTATHDLIML